MKPGFAPFLVLAMLSSPCMAAEHPCAGDARSRAGGLLKLHFDNHMAYLAAEPGGPVEGQAQDVMNWSLGETVKTLKPLKAPAGHGKFDVLEIEGYIYKGIYRMRFIYAQGPGNCTPMGQEIIELSDPY